MEWQPARVHNPHGWDVLDGDSTRRLQTSIVLVQESFDAFLALTRQYAEKGCTATRFYMVKTDPLNRGPLVAFCEHEILTD